MIEKILSIISDLRSISPLKSITQGVHTLTCNCLGRAQSSDSHCNPDECAAVCAAHSRASAGSLCSSFDAVDNNVVGLPPNTPKSRLSPLRTAITRH